MNIDFQFCNMKKFGDCWRQWLYNVNIFNAMELYISKLNMVNFMFSIGLSVVRIVAQ